MLRWQERSSVPLCVIIRQLSQRLSLLPGCPSRCTERCSWPRPAGPALGGSRHSCQYQHCTASNRNEWNVSVCCANSGQWKSCWSVFVCVCASVFYLARQCRSVLRDVKLWVNSRQVPVEVPTAQTSLQPQTLCDVWALRLHERKNN